MSAETEAPVADCMYMCMLYLANEWRRRLWVSDCCIKVNVHAHVGGLAHQEELLTCQQKMKNKLEHLANEWKWMLWVEIGALITCINVHTHMWGSLRGVVDMSTALNKWVKVDAVSRDWCIKVNVHTHMGGSPRRVVYISTALDEQVKVDAVSRDCCINSKHANACMGGSPTVTGVVCSLTMVAHSGLYAQLWASTGTGSVDGSPFSLCFTQKLPRLSLLLLLLSSFQTRESSAVKK